MDAHPSRYSSTVRVQRHRQEIIEDLATMVKNLLISFYRATGYKPTRIIFYLVLNPFTACLYDY